MKYPVDVITCMDSGECVLPYSTDEKLISLIDDFLVKLKGTNMWLSFYPPEEGQLGIVTAEVATAPHALKKSTAFHVSSLLFNYKKRKKSPLPKEVSAKLKEFINLEIKEKRVDMSGCLIK